MCENNEWDEKKKEKEKKKEQDQHQTPAELTTNYVTSTHTTDPFSTAVPLGEQTAYNLSGLYPKRDCSPKRVKLFVYSYDLGHGVKDRGKVNILILIATFRIVLNVNDFLE